MKEKTKSRIKTGLKVAGIAAGAAVIAGTLYVVAYPPRQGKNSPRSIYRADGVPKKAFDSRIRANLQSLIQLVRHGELCLPYKIGDKYYTGHNRELNKKIGDCAIKTAEITAYAVSHIVKGAITQSLEPRNVKGIAATEMKKDERSWFDTEEEEYDNMSEEEQAQIDENQLEVMNDIMFPDGNDED